MFADKGKGFELTQYAVSLTIGAGGEDLNDKETLSELTVHPNSLLIIVTKNEVVSEKYLD